MGPLQGGEITQELKGKDRGIKKPGIGSGFFPPII